MNPFADTLHVSVRVSATHRWFVIGLHAIACVVWLSLLAARAWLWPLGILLAISFIVSWRQASLKRASSILRLRWHADGRWQWQTRQHDWRAGRRVGSYVWADRLIVVRLRPDDAHWFSRTCVLFADALQTRTHRHLRARLTIAATDVADMSDA